MRGSRGLIEINRVGFHLYGGQVRAGAQTFWYCYSCDWKRIKREMMISEKLPLMMDSHSEFVPLRSCLSTLKIMFTLRINNLTHHKNIWSYNRIIEF